MTFRYSYGKLINELEEMPTSSLTDFLLIAPGDNPNDLKRISLENLTTGSRAQNSVVLAEYDSVAFDGSSHFLNSPGDTNGIIYWYGTKKGSQAFQNPFNFPLTDANKVNIQSNTSSFLDKLTDRITQVGINYDNQTANPQITFSFPEQALIFIYTIKSSQFPSYFPKSWTIQGSNDLQTWNLLDEEINFAGWTSSHQWQTFNVDAPEKYFYYRFNCTASTQGTRILLDEFEFYGTLGNPPYSQINLSPNNHNQILIIDTPNQAKINLFTGPANGFYCQFFKKSSSFLSFIPGQVNDIFMGNLDYFTSEKRLLELYYLLENTWLIREKSL